MALTCFKRECSEVDLCSIVSEADLFFKIGFLWRNEDVEDNRLGGRDSALLKYVLLLVCSGPYSHVTSQSLSLKTDKQINRRITNAAPYQLMLSGEIVLRLPLTFAQVLQDAFSRRTLLL
jgi:hypothetical protein